MSHETDVLAEKSLKKFSAMKVPHTCVIIFAILILCAVLTYILPAGEYNFITNEAGRKVVDPTSYHQVESSPVSLYQIMDAIPKGLVKMASLIVFVFIAGGTFSIINDTKTLMIGINKIVQKLRGKERIMIFAVMTIFSILGALMGFAAEAVIFVPLGVALARSVGYDAMVGVSIVLLGAYVGFSAGAFNPYTTGVAQGIVGLPLFSGLGLRLALHAVSLVIAVWYVIRYAEKVKKDLSNSYVYDVEQDAKESEGTFSLTDENFSVRHYLILLTMLVGFGIIIYGSIALKWSTTAMAPIFFGMGIISGIIGGLSGGQISEAWLNGAKSMVFANLLIGMGRGVLVVMEEGMILHTLVHGLATVLQSLPSSMIAVGMFVSNIFINFFVPSGSGQATLVMPIMSPLAEITGVSQQTAILAYQTADGFTNIIVPTQAVTTSCIGSANVNFVQWLRFTFPLTLMLWGVSIVFVVIADVLRY